MVGWFGLGTKKTKKKPTLNFVRNDTHSNWTSKHPTTRHRTSLSQILNETNCSHPVVKSSKQMASKNQNFRTGTAETSLSVSLKCALLCSKEKKEEEGSHTQLSCVFFNGKHSIMKILHHRRPTPPLPLSLISLQTSAFAARGLFRLLNS